MRAELLRLVRHSRRRAVYVGASLAVLALAAAATAVGESNGGKAGSAGGTLTMARIADIFTMDPVQTIDDFVDLHGIFRSTTGS